MKRILAFALMGLMIAAPVALAQGGKESSKKSQASQPVTHAQLAEIMVKALGLVRFLPNAPSAQQMFDVLMQNGISPQDGWKLDAVVTKADLSRVIVQALRKEDQVENPNDPQAWINVLKELGISLDRLSETVQSVEALPEAMGQDATMQSTDPLIYEVAFATSDSVQYTVDLDMVTRVFSEIEMISGEFQPIPPTPH
ncbi:MAG: hypothetical protein AB7V14_05295 [Kiritimatiellia bacterium]